MRVVKDEQALLKLNKSNSGPLELLQPGNPRQCNEDELNSAATRMIIRNLYGQSVPLGHCGWRMQCLAQAGRIPRVWWVAVGENVVCGAKREGRCVMNYAVVPVLYHAACDRRGKPIWIQNQTQLAVAASCVGHQSNGETERDSS